MTTRAILLGATALSLFAAAPAMADEALQQPSGEQPASAQATTPATPAPAATTAAPQTVVVTGSRIRRNAFNTTSPVQVVTNENAVLSGTIDATEVLQGSTAAAGSSQINNFFTGFIVEGGPGIQTVGLNSLGAQRTLVLLNGRRLPPSGVRGQVGAVDLQTIPSLAVSRFEILNEGASPIYGSDAVGGVVNAITRRDVDGWEFNFSVNAPFEGGAEELNVGVLWGKTEDRWNVMVAADYFKQEALKYGDRDFCFEDYVFNADNGQRADFIDPSTGRPFCFGIGFSFNRVGPSGQVANLTQAQLVALGIPATAITPANVNSLAIQNRGRELLGTGTWLPDPTATARTVGQRPDAIPLAPGQTVPVGPNAGQTVTAASCLLPTGQVIPQGPGLCSVLLTVPGYRRAWGPVAGAIGQPVFNQLQYNHPTVANTDIVSPSERINLYATGAADLDILGGVEVFGELIYARRKSSQDRGAQLFFSLVDPNLSANNIFNPFANSVAPAAAQPVIIRPFNNEQTVTTWQVVGGIRGQTGSGLFGGFMANGNWEVYAQTSEGEGEYKGSLVFLSRIEDSLRATLVNGQPTCTPTAPSLTTTCVPINFFDPRVVRGELTPTEEAYLFADPNLNVGNTVYKQTVVEGNVSGDIFQIPGASDAAKLNVGFQYRTYSINDVPGAVTRTFLRPGTSNQALTSVAGITAGEDTVKEVYGELVVPLIANRPFIENLEFTAAYRFTDYDSYSSNETNKFTLSWQITPEITVVGMTGTSYRAPALFELYLGDQSGFTGQTAIDPCVNWGTQQQNPIARQRCAAEGIPDNYTGAGSSAAVITGGGLGTLKEEESESTIYSFIYRPTGINLNLRIDAWKISVTDQVAQFGAGAILNSCYTDTTGRAPIFCSLFTRAPGSDPTRPFNILTVQNDYVNINVQEVEGIDLKIVYDVEFAFGDLTIDSAFRWTNRNASGLFSDTDLFEDQGFIGEPVFNGQVQFRFRRGDWTYAWTVNGVGPTRTKTFNGGNPVQTLGFGTYYTFNGVTRLLNRAETETTIYHAATIRWLTDDWTVLAGVQNIFDEAPPSISIGTYFARLGTGPLASQYDFAGRSAVVQVVRRF